MLFSSSRIHQKTLERVRPDPAANRAAHRWISGTLVSRATCSSSGVCDPQSINCFHSQPLHPIDHRLIAGRCSGCPVSVRSFLQPCGSSKPVEQLLRSIRLRLEATSYDGCDFCPLEAEIARAWRHQDPRLSSYEDASIRRDRFGRRSPYLTDRIIKNALRSGSLAGTFFLSKHLSCRSSSRVLNRLRITWLRVSIQPLTSNEIALE